MIRSQEHLWVSPDKYSILTKNQLSVMSHVFFCHSSPCCFAGGDIVHDATFRIPFVVFQMKGIETLLPCSYAISTPNSTTRRSSHSCLWGSSCHGYIDQIDNESTATSFMTSLKYAAVFRQKAVTAIFVNIAFDHSFKSAVSQLYPIKTLWPYWQPKQR